MELLHTDKVHTVACSVSIDKQEARGSYDHNLEWLQISLSQVRKRRSILGLDATEDEVCATVVELWRGLLPLTGCKHLLSASSQSQ